MVKNSYRQKNVDYVANSLFKVFARNRLAGKGTEETTESRENTERKISKLKRLTKAKGER